MQYHKVKSVLQKIEDNWPKPIIMTNIIPIIGEFSAGKSRFLGNLLEEHVSDELLPTTSSEAQTAIPLIVQFGLQNLLTGHNHEHQGIAHLPHFPSREEMLKNSYLASLSYLKLSAKLPALKGNGQQIIQLVDTKGESEAEDIDDMDWDDIDLDTPFTYEINDDLSESDNKINGLQIIFNQSNIQIPIAIYVVTNRNLQAQEAQDNLTMFLSENEDYFTSKRIKIQMVVTHCTMHLYSSNSMNRHQLLQNIQKRVVKFQTNIRKSIPHIQLSFLDFIPVELADATPVTEKRIIRQTFWRQIQEHIPEAKSKHPIHSFPLTRLDIFLKNLKKLQDIKPIFEKPLEIHLNYIRLSINKTTKDKIQRLDREIFQEINSRCPHLQTQSYKDLEQKIKLHTTKQDHIQHLLADWWHILEMEIHLIQSEIETWLYSVQSVLKMLGSTSHRFPNSGDFNIQLQNHIHKQHQKIHQRLLQLAIIPIEHLQLLRDDKSLEECFNILCASSLLISQNKYLFGGFHE